MLMAGAALAMALVGGWTAVVGVLWWQQDRMIFPGWGFDTVQASGIEPGDERLEVVTPDGVRLTGALRRAAKPNRGLVLIFGGNAEDADWRLRHMGGWLRDVDLATFFYRGYGPSGGRPSEAALVADATLVHDRLVALLEPQRVVAAGFSLGSGVAAQLARRRPLEGLILVTAFDSILSVAARRYPFAPVPWLLRHPFRSDEALAGLAVPVAVIAAEQDDIVPPRHTQRLIDELAQPVLVAWIKDADHVSIYDHVAYRDAFRAALDRLLATAPADTAAPPSEL
jgi:hypothetical protein